MIIRALCMVLAMMAGPAIAQIDTSSFDPLLVQTCLTNADQKNTSAAECIGISAATCMSGEGGSTTVGMGQCLGQELDLWDRLLNDTYEALVVQAKEIDADMADIGSSADPQEPALQQMQRSWIAYRDASCAYERTRWGGGTGSGPASVQCMVELTAQQFLRLKVYRDLLG